MISQLPMGEVCVVVDPLDGEMFACAIIRSDPAIIKVLDMEEHKRAMGIRYYFTEHNLA
jgi:hypothetical protein